MAVLINNQTKQGEQLSPEQEQAALQQGTHSYALVTPEGDITPSSSSEYHSLVKNGHRPANESELKDLLSYAKHSTPSEQVKTFAEGAARGALPFGISTGVERLLGVKSEDIRGREEVNPGLHGTGEAAGLIGSSFIPGGQLKGAAQLGEAVVGATKIASPFARAAVKSAAEMAMIQSGDEVAKMYAEDPHQSLQTAAANIGLSSLLGGGLGGSQAILSKGIEKLWETKAGQKVEEALNHIYNKAHGIDIAQPLDAELSPAASSFKSILDKHLTKETAQKGLNLDSPEAITGALFGLLSHSGPAGIAAALGTKVASKSLEAVKTSLLKTLATDAPLAAGPFKAMVLMAEQAYKGARAIDKGVNGLFKAGIGEGIDALDLKSASKLDQQVQDAMLRPEDQLDHHEDLSAALPDQMQAMGEMKAKAVQYLNSVRPDTANQAPLDPQRMPNSVEQAKYQRALMVADQPLSILSLLKKGNLLPQDLIALQTIYPQLYGSLQSKVGQKVIDMKTKGEPIPYRLQLGLSLFLGMPMDSSTMPQNIMANQAHNTPQPQASSKPPTASQSKALTQLPLDAATPGQARELQRKTLK